MSRSKVGYWMSSFWNVGSTGITSCCSFLFTLLGIHFLGLTIYGEYVFIQSFGQLSIFPHTSMWGGMSNEIATNKAQSNGVLKWMIPMSFLYGALGSTVYALWLHGTALLFWIHTFYFGVLSLINVFPNILNADAKYREAGVVQAAAAASTVIGLLCLIVTHQRDITLLIVITSACMFLAIFILALTIDKRRYLRGTFDWLLCFRNAVRMMSAIFTMNIADILMLSGTRLLFRFVGFDSLGVYDLAMKFIQLGRTTIIALFGTLTPFLVRRQQDTDQDALRNLYRGISLIASTMSAVIFSTVLFVGPLIHQWVKSSPIDVHTWMMMFAFLTLGNSWHASTIPQTSMMFAEANTRGVYLMESMTLGTFSVLYLSLRHHFGGTAIAIATGLAMAVSGLVYSSIVDREKGIDWRAQFVCRLCVNAGSIAYILVNFLHPTWATVSPLFIAMTTAFCLYYLWKIRGTVRQLARIHF